MKEGNESNQRFANNLAQDSVNVAQNYNPDPHLRVNQLHNIQHPVAPSIAIPVNYGMPQYQNFVHNSASNHQNVVQNPAEFKESVANRQLAFSDITNTRNNEEVRRPRR